MLLGALHRFEHHIGGRCAERSVDATGMEPLRPALAKDSLPVDVAWPELAGGGVAPIGAAHGAADTKTAFGEVEPVAHFAPDAVVVHPFDKVGVDTTLQDEIFDQAPHGVIGECGDHSRLQAEAAAQPPSHVVFAAAFPGSELAGGVDAPLAGIEAEHDFAQRDAGVCTGFWRFDFDRHKSWVVGATMFRRRELKLIEHVNYVMFGKIKIAYL